MDHRPSFRHAAGFCSLLVVSGLILQGATARELLERSASAGVLPPGLTVTYEAMHPFHGGTIVEISGDGHGLRTTRRRGQLQATVRQVQLETDEILDLVVLLVELEAWEQREPEREPVPDEGRASVLVAVGGVEFGFWEWYNDMGQRDRLLRVSALMTELVPR